MPSFVYEYAGQPHTVSLERGADDTYAVVIDGRALAVRARPLPDGGWLMELDGVQVRVWAAAQGQERHVFAAGRHVRLTRRAPGRRRAAAGGDSALTAPMPGVVRAVLVEAGQPVQRGQTLLVLEAMKMEIRITAPMDGVVTALPVLPGTVVERGQALAEVQPKA